MKSLFAQEPHHKAADGKTAVLLINLGSPETATAGAVRPYLANFLSDQRVIELPKYLWQPILRGLILPFRSKASAHGYRQIWLQNGSPLLVYTRKQAELLAERLPDNVIVRYAMSYSAPLVQDVMAELKHEGVSQLLVIPLYPQYAASSSGAALDKVFQTMLKQRNMMSLRTVRSFHNHPAYIEALREQVAAYWQTHGRSDKLLLSFHGIPQFHDDYGDPYPEECRETARLLAQALNIGENDYIVAFQSQFGKAKWIGPSTQDLLDSLPKQGVETLDIMCPAFVSDCLETMEEIAIAGREQFHAAGGRQFRYIPCLNDNASWIAALETICREHLGGWPDETR